MSGVNNIIPVTCKQLKNLRCEAGQVKLGHATVNLVVLVAFCVEAEQSDNKWVIACEDTTALVNEIESYLPDCEIQHFNYYEIVLKLTTGNDDTVNKYVKTVRPVTDFTQVYAHLLEAYAYHLRVCAQDIPLKTHKQYVKDEQMQQVQVQQQQQFQQFGTSTAAQMQSSFTGVQPQLGQGAVAPFSMQQGHQQNHMQQQQGPPQDRVLHFLQSNQGATDGFTAHDISARIGIHPDEVNRILVTLQDEGSIFTSIDDYHFSAC